MLNHQQAWHLLLGLWQSLQMNYRDFSIRIVGKNADGYDVRVELPAGNARAYEDGR